MKYISKVLLVVLYLGWFCGPLFAQTKDNLPVPEYFGIYAVVDGRLVKLDGQQVHTDKMDTVRLGQRNGVGNILQGQPVASSTTAQVPELSSDLKIIVFSQTGGMESPLDTAKALHLERLVFVQNLTVDTGFPNNVRRSGVENGWESGDAPELLGMASGDRAKSLEFLFKPMPGHQDMVVAVLADKLTPGLYKIRLGETDPLFGGGGGLVFAVPPVSDGEAANCVDATVTYAMNISNNKYTPCGGGAGAANGASPQDSGTVATGQSSSAAGQPSNYTGATAASCGNYQSCFNAGLSAYNAANWPTAIIDFQAAANEMTTTGDPWVWLGRLYLQNGQYQEASAAWDKALRFGSTVLIGACHEIAFRPCQRGDLSLSVKAVGFLANGSETVFSGAPSEISFKGVLNNSRMGHVSFGIEVGNRRYNFDFFPIGVACQVELFVNCPQAGTAEQLAVANYIGQTLPKLASGALGPPPTAVRPSTAESNSASIASVGSRECGQGVDAGYSLLLQGHLYKVKTNSAGPNSSTFLFFDEKGASVTDANLLQQLAAAAWTRENVIASPDARNGSSRVSAILGTSKALQNYSTVQDALARGMVEALEAVVTDGASLSKAVPNLTKGVFFNQLKNAPRTVFVVAAQRGLEASLAAYKQMESVPFPPADATVLNTPDLVRIKALYIQARTLELPYAALASKLMPTSASQLTNQAFASAISEIIPSVGLNSTDQVTLNDLLNFQKSVGNLSGSLPALQAYSENLKLALNLADANNRTISEWAAESASTCGIVTATNKPPAANTSSADIRSVDFRNFDYPSHCWKSYPNSGFGQTVHVTNGEWKKGAEGSQIYFDAEKPVYADLIGNAQEQAVVVASCGFTTGNDWDTEVFVFRMSAGQPALITTLSSSDWGESGLGIIWRVANKGIAVTKGEIDVSYYAGGSHAQPAWVATARFKWNGTRFVRTAVDRKKFVA